MSIPKGAIDESGNKYGRLTVTGVSSNRAGRKLRWNCRCECGREVCVIGGNLRRRATTSCGCFQVDSSRARHTTHGMSSGKVHPAYNSYMGAKARCTQLGHVAAKNYSGRGVKFLLPPFAEFWEVMQHTWAPGMTLDRCDNDGHYEMGNIRWATRLQQSANSRRKRVYQFEGKDLRIEDLARLADVPVRTMQQRILRLGVDAAVKAPRRTSKQAVYAN